ncbi:MAG: hypothetical protein ACRENE_35215 [Polyangiaceae bacterium]
MSTHVSFAVHQEADEVPSPSLMRVVMASVLVASVGVVAAGALLVASSGSLEPEDTGARALREPVRWPVERTPVWKTRRGIELRDRQRRVLDEGGKWVDAGVVTLPIDEATDIVIGQSP